MTESTMMSTKGARDWLFKNDKVKKPLRAQTMYRWLREGRFPNAHKGPSARGGGPHGRWRIPLSDLEAFVAPRPGPQKKEPEG